jgi:hypothetical protein
MFKRSERIAALDDLQARLMRVIEERAVAFGDDPVGQSGLHSRRFDIKGAPETPIIVEHYSLDRGLIRAIGKLLKQARIETTLRDGEKPEQSLAEYKAMLDAGTERVAKANRFWAERKAAGLKGDPSLDKPPVQAVESAGAVEPGMSETPPLSPTGEPK